MRALFDERYLAMRGAMAAHDAGALHEMHTPDFVSEDVEGRRRGVEAVIAAVINLEIDRSKRSAETTITHIEIEGDEARLVQRYAMTTTETSRTLPQALWAESHDVWHRAGEQWRIARTVTQRLEVVRNGERVYRTRLNPGDGRQIAELRGPVH